MKSVLAVIMATVMMFTTVGCGTPKTSDLVTALTAVSDASSVAVIVTQSLVVLGRIDQGTADQVSDYSSGIGTAVQASIAELNGTNTNPQKIAAITAAFAKVASPAFGENAPQVKAAIEAVSAAVKIFLNQLNNAGLLRAANAAPNAPIKLESGDKAALKAIQKKVADTNLKAAKLKEVN